MLFENLNRSLPRDRPLNLKCGRCGHAAAWDRDTAIRRFGPGAIPADVRRMARCGQCGEGADVRVWI